VSTEYGEYDIIQAQESMQGVGDVIFSASCYLALFSIVIKHPVAVQIAPDLFEIKEKARSLRL